MGEQKHSASKLQMCQRGREGFLQPVTSSQVCRVAGGSAGWLVDHRGLKSGVWASHKAYYLGTGDLLVSIPEHLLMTCSSALATETFRQALEQQGRTLSAEQVRAILPHAQAVFAGFPAQHRPFEVNEVADTALLHGRCSPATCYTRCPRGGARSGAPTWCSSQSHTRSSPSSHPLT